MIYNNKDIADLSPLQGMPLTSLNFGWTGVSDLTSLKGLKLETLDFNSTPVSDLSPLKGMKLTWLRCDNLPNLGPRWAGKGSPYTPLKEMPLKVITCDFAPNRDAEVLRSIKTLEAINPKGAKAIFPEVGKTAPPVDRNTFVLEMVSKLGVKSRVEVKALRIMDAGELRLLPDTLYHTDSTVTKMNNAIVDSETT